MRLAFAAAIALALGVATPAFAVKRQQPTGPEWQRCYDLGWDRGVHIEQNEMPHWLDECMTGSIPFDTAEATINKHEQRSVH